MYGAAVGALLSRALGPWRSIGYGAYMYRRKYLGTLSESARVRVQKTEPVVPSSLQARKAPVQHVQPKVHD